MSEPDIEQVIKVIRTGLVEVIENAEPSKLVRIASFIKRDDDDDRRGMLAALHQEAAKQYDKIEQKRTEESGD